MLHARKAPRLLSKPQAGNNGREANGTGLAVTSLFARRDPRRLTTEHGKPVTAAEAGTSWRLGIQRDISARGYGGLLYTIRAASQPSRVRGPFPVQAGEVAECHRKDDSGCNSI